MKRAPVCFHYQSGLCWNGDLCSYTHPTVRCRAFKSSGWCPYGYNCHFWHDQTNRPSANEHATSERKLCLFFANGQCKYGDRCNFSHDMSNQCAVENRTLSEFQASHKPCQVTLSDRHERRLSEAFYSSSPDSGIPESNTLTGLPNVSRKPFRKPKSNTQIKLDTINKVELFRLYNLEVEKLLKSHSSDKLRELECLGEGRNFCLRFSSTDPDWAYDVCEVVLSINLHPLYPSECLKVTVLEKDYLPPILVQHLNASIKQWLLYRHELLKKRNQTELYLQPFLRWLDRNLEDLFTEGLRKYKAGLEQDNSIAPILPSAHRTKSNLSDDNDDDYKESTSSIEEQDEIISGDSFIKNPDDPSESESAEEKGIWIEPVPSPQPQRELFVSGTFSQVVKFGNLHLSGNAGTLTQRRLAATLHCTRCSLAFEWVFSLHGGQLGPSSSSSTTHNMRSLPPYTVQCARCKQSMDLMFEAQLAHAFDSRIGTLHLTGCVADDIRSTQSELLVSCTECQQSVRIHGLETDRSVTQRCLSCHSLIGLKFNGIQLELVKDGINRPVQTGSRKTTKASGDLSRRQRRSISSALNPIIQDNAPLPEYGTCKHYKKSYRWLRFPCCGRLQPCDVCHDQQTADGHEMELATRMVCGFCAKEQAFSDSKPCIRCGKGLTASRSAHWEGGSGCRNKTLMSKKDSRKYKV